MPVSTLSHSVVFSEQFYFPDGWGGAQLPRDLTMHLASAGFGVEVVCGSDQYAPVEGDPGPDPAASGVRIRRVPPLLGGDIHRRKFLRQLWFYACALPLLLFRRPPATFVTQTNPPLVVPMVALVAMIMRRPFVIIAQDLYPEVMVAHRMIDPHKPIGRFLSRLFRWAYRRARNVVALGPTMCDRLTAKGVDPARIVCISNWSTGQPSVVRGPANRLCRAWGLEDNFVVLYSGNIGIAHDVATPILAVRQALEMVPHLRLLFIGKGARLEEAKRLVAEHGLEGVVQFRPLVPMARLPESIGLADLALVSLREGFEGLVVPSKLFGYMARGIPTVYVGPDSDIRHFVETSAGGACIRNGAVDELSDLFVRMAGDQAEVRALGEAARTYYDRHLCEEVALGRYAELIRRVCVEGTEQAVGQRS